MSEILAIALNSLQNDMRQVEHVAMNLANTLTPGYKRQVAVAQPFSSMVERATAASGGLAPQLAGSVQTFVDVRAGSLKRTGEGLDLAIDGEGFFEVATPEGPAYTRQGNFRVDERGRLVTSQGQPVMGAGGEIMLADAKVRIDRNGNVFSGGDAAGAVAQLKVVRFEDPAPMTSLGNGLLASGDGMTQLSGTEIQVQQGYLENSNVSTQQEMIHLMHATRHFESVQKAIQGYDEVIGTAIRKLGEV